MTKWRSLSLRLGRLNPRTVDPRCGYDQWSDHYTCERNPLLELEGKALLRTLPNDLRGKRVLDVGCGTARIMRMLAARNAGSVTGVDFSLKMLARAAENSSGIGRTALAAGDAVALPFHHGSFDLVTCSLVAGHVSRLGDLVSELARVVRPGGDLLLSDFHPFGHLLGWERSFVRGEGKGERVCIQYYRHLHEDYFRSFRESSLQVVGLWEPTIDESVRHFFESSRTDRANYRRFFGFPLVLLFELKASSPASGGVARTSHAPGPG